MPQQHRPDCRRTFTDAVIHPGNDSIIFIAARDTDTPEYIVIHEFADRKWTKSYEHRIHGLPNSPGGHIQKANSYGLYALCHSHIQNPREVPAEACHHSREILDGQHTTCATYFNTYLRAFSRQYFQTPDISSGARFWTWNGCVATSYLCGFCALVLHQSSLEYLARKTHAAIYEMEDPKDNINMSDWIPEVVGVDDCFLVVANSRGFTAWGF